MFAHVEEVQSQHVFGEELLGENPLRTDILSILTKRRDELIVDDFREREPMRDPNALAFRHLTVHGISVVFCGPARLVSLAERIETPSQFRSGGEKEESLIFFRIHEPGHEQSVQGFTTEIPGLGYDISFAEDGSIDRASYFHLAPVLQDGSTYFEGIDPSYFVVFIGMREKYGYGGYRVYEGVPEQNTYEVE